MGTESRQPKVIYTVGCFFFDEKWSPKHWRVWGWFSNFEDAEKAVLANATDMFEIGYYNYAIIEEVEEGLLTNQRELGWYKAEYSKGSNDPVVSKIEKPEELKGFAHWTLG